MFSAALVCIEDLDNWYFALQRGPIPWDSLEELKNNLSLFQSAATRKRERKFHCFALDVA